MPLSASRLARREVLALPALGRLKPLLGANRPQHGLHFQPDGGIFGDPIPFFWDGTYHVFYLRGQFLPGGKLTALGWHHLASRNLVAWEEMPPALLPDENDRSCATGSIIERDGVFHAFYSGSTRIGVALSHASSRDLITWTKDAANPILTADPVRYNKAHWRDPHVFWNPEAKEYWMAIATQENSDANYPYAGCVALATSTDLAQWAVKGTMYSDRQSIAAECPDVFPFHDGWGLIYYTRTTRLRVAAHPQGPWRDTTLEDLSGLDFNAGKSMWDGRRRIVIGMIPRRSSDFAEGEYGGTMLVPRELDTDTAGNPIVRCPAEVTAACREDATAGQGMRVFQPLMGSPGTTGQASARLTLTDGKPGMLWWSHAPSNYYFRITVNASSGARAGIYLRTQRKPDAPEGKPLDQGYLLDIEPAERTISLRYFNTWDRLAEIRRLRLNSPTGRQIQIEMIVDRDILEVFFDNQRSFVSRLFGEQRGGLALLAWDGPVSFENGFIGRIPS
jgi:beta-fructofuranosidase